MERKAQAAMEFLMTYGWAILVVLVAIGALAYFGVLSPDNFLPERCTGPAGLDCLDKAAIEATPNNVTFVLKNNVGFDITSLSVTSASDSCGSVSGSFIQTENASGAYNVSNRAENNRKVKVTVTCGTDFSTGRFKSNIGLSYANAQSGLSHTATVAVTGAAS